MLRWEYKTVVVDVGGFLQFGRIDDMSIDAQLGELGNDGWELVAVSPDCGKSGLHRLIYTLKRPLAAPSEAA